MTPSENSSPNINSLLLHVLSLRYCQEPSEPLEKKLLSLKDEEWDDLVWLARQHALAPLLYYNLQHIPHYDEFPAGIMQTLREIYQVNALRNMAIYGEFHKVLVALNEQEVPTVVLKGIYLAHAVYCEIALRQMGDVDILVKREDLNKVDKVLDGFGYSITTDQRDRDYWLNDHFHLRYFMTGARIPLEVHWRLLRPNNPFKVNTREAWEKSYPVSLAGAHAKTLSPEHLLVHSCLHVSFQHKFEFFVLRSLCDLAEILGRFKEQLDLHRVRDITIRWGIGRSVYLTLLLARELLQAAVPDELLQSLRQEDFDPQFPGWIMEQVTSVRNEKGNPGSNPKLSEQFRRVLFTAGLPEKMAALQPALFPPRRDMARWYLIHSSSPSLLLYYPIRMANSLYRYGIKFWLFLTGDQDTIGWIERERKLNLVLEWLASPGNETYSAKEDQTP